MTEQSILIVGCGNMGGAMLTGWLAGGIDPELFTVVDPVLAEVPAGVTLQRELPANHDGLVLLGIKPQLLDEVAPGLGPLAGPGSTVISMLAGIELASLAARFPQAAGVVRVMPNLAAALGKSPVALAGQGLAEERRAAITTLMRPLGEPLWLGDDSQFDLITALVGSGPAFAYRFIAALASEAASLGLDPAQAERFAIAMIEGAAALAAASEASPAELARRVSSPGGNTEAGLKVLDADDALTSLIGATLRAARDRGAELAKAARES
jgi:pyrroline-5-carboxylate reductase